MTTSLSRTWAARHKQERSAQGRAALATHVGIYTLVQAGTKAAAYQVGGVRVPALAQLAGAVAEAVTHAVIDDGRILARAAAGVPEPAPGSRAFRLRTALHQITDKSGFHSLAAHGVNGRMLLDQAAHKQIQIPVGAAVTVAVAALLARRRSR